MYAAVSELLISPPRNISPEAFQVIFWVSFPPSAVSPYPTAWVRRSKMPPASPAALSCPVLSVLLNPYAAPPSTCQVAGDVLKFSVFDAAIRTCGIAAIAAAMMTEDETRFAVATFALRIDRPFRKRNDFPNQLSI